MIIVIIINVIVIISIIERPPAETPRPPTWPGAPVCYNLTYYTVLTHTMHIYIYVCMYVCMYVYIYVYIYKSLFTYTHNYYHYHNHYYYYHYYYHYYHRSYYYAPPRPWRRTGAPREPGAPVCYNIIYYNIL